MIFEFPFSRYQKRCYCPNLIIPFVSSASTKMAHLTHPHAEKEYVHGSNGYDDVNIKTLDSEKNSQDGYVSEFSPAEQKAIIHRIDRRLVVTCGFMYCISLMDRTNTSAAVIAGYVTDIGA